VAAAALDAVTDADPILRETGLYALTRVNPEEATGLADRLVADPDVRVRALANQTSSINSSTKS